MNTKEVSDSEILMLIAENTEEANELLFNKHKHIIDIYLNKYNSILYKLGIEKQEAYSEALYSYNDAINSYNESKEASFATFLTLCIKRRLIKLVRKYSTEKSKFYNNVYSLDYIYEGLNVPLVETLPDSEFSDPLHKMTQDESLENLNIKIRGKLSELEYEVYEYMLDNLNYNEIALMLDKNPKQIDNAMQRIKLKIKEIIENSNHE